MKTKTINDTKLLRLIDQGLTQVQTAKELGVSKQAVHARLRTLRGRTTYAIAAAKVSRMVNSKIDAVEQLKIINARAHDLLKKAEDDAPISVKLMAEIRNQLRLQLDIYEMLYSLQGAAEFQESVLEVLEEANPNLRKKVISKLNEKSALRSALRFK